MEINKENIALLEKKNMDLDLKNLHFQHQLDEVKRNISKLETGKVDCSLNNEQVEDIH
jgi:hypothetical protein